MQVWVYAAAQNFNSLGVAFGGLITMSSYNKYNNKIIRFVNIVLLISNSAKLPTYIITFAAVGA